MQKCKSPSDYIEQLSEQYSNITVSASIYGKAMQMCNRKKHYHGVKKIMDIMLREISEKHGVKIENVNGIVFNIFFNAMSKANQPDVVHRYFKIMTNDLDIAPDLIMFGTLIKSCREQGRFRLAEIYWKLMENTYNIKPNHILFHEMMSVYLTAGLYEAAINKFKEFLYN